MHGFKSTILLGMLVTCGTLLAAEPATGPAPPDAATQKVADRLDKLIVERLEPAEASKPIRLHATLKVVPADEWVAVQGHAGPATTQPVEIELALDDEAARHMKADERDQRKLDEYTRALAEEERAMSEALLAARRAHEQADGTYLGIGVESPDDTLRAQLSLPPGAGLVINYLDENGPSKSAVQVHDVLQKLDDQLLINGEQLVALVRMHKPGDTVSLTLLRKAKPVTVDVELGRRKVSQGNAEPKADLDAVARAYAPQSLQAWTVAPQPSAIAKYNTVYGDGDLAPAYWTTAWKASANVQDRPTTFNDGDLLVSVTGRGELVAVNIKDGRVLYHGPIGTEQQWNALPALVRDKLASWRRVVQPSAATHAAEEKPEPRTK